MTQEEFTAQIKSSLNEDIHEMLNGPASEMINIITKVYEKGFWKGFEIGTQVETRSENPSKNNKI